MRGRNTRKTMTQLEKNEHNNNDRLGKRFANRGRCVNRPWMDGNPDSGNKIQLINES